MAETIFQKQVLSKLGRMEKNISCIMEYLEDSRLTAEEKKLLQESHKHEKEGKLLSSQDLNKKLGL